MAKAESAHITIAPALSSPASTASSTGRLNFKSAGAISKARELRNLFEAGMDFGTALGCLGLSERADEFRSSWECWAANFG